MSVLEGGGCVFKVIAIDFLRVDVTIQRVDETSYEIICISAIGQSTIY